MYRFMGHNFELFLYFVRKNPLKYLFFSNLWFFYKNNESLVSGPRTPKTGSYPEIQKFQMNYLAASYEVSSGRFY